MSLSDVINTISTSLSNIKDAIIYDGGTISGDITTYATEINNLPENVVVKREISSQGVYQKPARNFIFSLPSNAIDIGAYALSFAFYGCSSLMSADLSSLTIISGSDALSHAFYNCSSLTTVNLSSLTTISGSDALSYAFYNCTSLTSVDLSSLTTISGSNVLSDSFYNCTSLTTVNLSLLTTISGNNALSYAFQYCTSLTSLSFPSLTSTSFGNYTNQFNDMLYRVTGCTVHFPSNLQSVIGNWSSVTSGFGGTNTTVLFDLPSTT